MPYKINPSVKEIPRYIPGKSKEEIAEEYGLKIEDIIKLASNENPLGPPPLAIKALTESIWEVATYPEEDAGELRSEIARYLGLKKENIIAGNGSDEILDLVTKIFLEKGDQAIIPVPTFSMYASLVKIYSGQPIFVQLDKNFNFNTEKIVESISEKTKLIFICSPNNPTGTKIPDEGLLRILEEDVIVILDEAYVEFSDISNIDKIKEYENLIVCRTFSKAFGLAGLRVGYGVAPKQIIDLMLRIKTPFSVNLLAQKAAIASLKDKKHLENTIRLIKEQRKFLISNLSKIPKIKVYPSYGNFVLVDVKETGKNSKKVADALLKRGIIIRDCSSFYGMDDHHIRVSIGKPEENKKFLEALKEVIST
jgi:histidinol-phosphate aminotransferase